MRECGSTAGSQTNKHERAGVQGWPQSGVELQSLAPAAAAAYGSSETVQLLNRNQSADVPLNVFAELAG